MRRSLHLTARFFGALRPGPPRAADTAWVGAVLTPSELALWSRQPAHDRRHAVAVAREVQRALAGTEFDGDPRWLAAGLLHDVGKLDARLGPLARVAATLAGAAAGHEMAGAWSERRGITRRFGLYLRHGELGADRIRVVSGREEAARWAATHHHPEGWAALGFPDPVVAALAAADRD